MFRDDALVQPPASRGHLAPERLARGRRRAEQVDEVTSGTGALEDGRDARHSHAAALDNDVGPGFADRIDEAAEVLRGLGGGHGSEARPAGGGSGHVRMKRIIRIIRKHPTKIGFVPGWKRQPASVRVIA